MSTPNGARDWLDLVMDPGWEPLFEDVLGGDPLEFPGYAEQLQRARASTGCSESVLVAHGSIEGNAVVAFAFEFGFLGGSMGVATGERVCRAFELGARENIPVVALTASGGARMQEGMLALAQMPATLAARALLADAHQPFIAYLRNPTTGGVYASFASGADILWAQPGATIGFAGPRVAETVTGETLPDGSHTAESAFAAGLIDALVEPERARAELSAALRALAPLAPRATAGQVSPAGRGDVGGAEAVRAARAPGRPAGVGYIGPAIPLRRGGDDDTIVTAIGDVNGRAAMFVAMDRFEGTGRPAAAAFRRAQHAIATAVRLRLPIVTLIDTPGAEPGAAAEHDGIAREISAMFETLLRAPVPSVACVVGEGGSGGALAFGACDRLLIQENAIFSVIAPEGAASILRRDDVDQIARELRLRARDLLEFGLADAIVAEPAGGAGADPAAARALLHDAVSAALHEIEREQVPTARRAQRWRVAR